MKGTIYLTVGLIGTGKSTWAQKTASVAPALIVSKDSVRQMIYGTYIFNNELEYLVDKITDSAIMNIASEIILGIQPYKTLILDEHHLTRKNRLSYITLIKQIEREHNVKDFFDIQYIYFLDEMGSGLNRRCKENRGVDEDQWFQIHCWQEQVCEVPTQKELDDLNVSMITLNTFAGEL